MDGTSFRGMMVTTNFVGMIGVSPQLRPKHWVIGSIALLLTVYTVVRACTVSFTWDESFTFMHHVSKGKFFQDTFDGMGANHHLLNVWTTWLSMKLFGDGEFALRLPNLVAHFLYLYGSARIALRAPSAVLAVTAFILLNAHPYLLDFFSLARGYGIANGCIMMSLWCMWRCCSDGETTARVGRTVCWAALAALANTMALNFLMAIVAVFLVRWAGRIRKEGAAALMSRILVLTVLTGAALALILPTTLAMSKGGSLHMGCDRVWEGSVATFGEKFLYHTYYGSDPLTIMGWFLVVLAIWIGIAVWRSVVRKRWSESGPFLSGLGVLAAVVVIMAVQHYALGIPWPRARTALYMLPLVLFTVVASLITPTFKRWQTAAVATLFCAPVLVHMAGCWNMVYAIEWKGSGELRRMLALLDADRAPLSRMRPVLMLATGAESIGAIPYYVKTRDLHWLGPTARFAPDPIPQSDYYIVEFDGQDAVDTRNWTLLYHSEECNTSLFRDERFRATMPEVVFHASKDMEEPDIEGACQDHHVSGRQCVRYDASMRTLQDLYWRVPPGWDGANVLVSGTLMLRQWDQGNWLSLSMMVARGDSIIEKRDLPSQPQVARYERWNRVGCQMRTSVGLRAGDVISFTGWPSSAETTYLVDDMELWILRDRPADPDPHPAGTAIFAAP